MATTLYRMWIHAVFPTFYQRPVITPILECHLQKILADHLHSLGCQAEIINGTSNHVHLLFQHNPTKSIADIMRDIKGDSSNWMNQQPVMEKKFAWDKGYGAFSVSHSQHDRVMEFIRDQKNYHQKFTYDQEFQRLATLTGARPNTYHPAVPGMRSLRQAQ